MITGPLVLDTDMQPAAPVEFIGNGRVAVPTHFFKAVLCEHSNTGHEVFAFLFPQPAGLPGPTLRYAVSIDRLESLLGVDLFASFPDAVEALLEASAPSAWPVPEEPGPIAGALMAFGDCGPAAKGRSPPPSQPTTHSSLSSNPPMRYL